MIKKSLTISFEFFPPKTPEGMTSLEYAASELSLYYPEFFSVTFGAGGSTQNGTIETVKMLQSSCSINVAPHLTCVGSQQYDILKTLHLYKSMNVKRIVTLRGDLPQDKKEAGEFNYAHELVAFIRQNTGDFFFIEVAAYPEIHPQAKTAAEDIINLKRKYECGANRAITQYFFNPDAYFYLLDACEKHQIMMPVVPGIMPITQFARLARFSDACGAEIPRWMRKRLEDFGEDKESCEQFGLEVVHALCKRLLEGGAPGLHFYTLNKAKATINLLKALMEDGVIWVPALEDRKQTATQRI